jgi:hypothetical protein
MPESDFSAQRPPSSSSFAGEPGQPWSLGKAVDALSISAKLAGRPSSLWLAGIAYPSIGLGIAAGTLKIMSAGNALATLEDGSAALAVALQATFAGFAHLGAQLGILPLFYFAFRLRAGLARIATPDVWAKLARDRQPRLRDAWRAGKGLTAPATGLLLMISLMLAGVLGLLYAPLLFFWGGISQTMGGGVSTMLWLVILLPALVLLCAYAILLSILHLLALQSLACNQRGVSSALVHAWRLAKHDPWSTSRTLAVGLMLDVALAAIATALVLLGSLLPGGGVLAGLINLCLLGFAGVVQANYWSRAYRQLGGMLTAPYQPPIK